MAAVSLASCSFLANVYASRRRLFGVFALSLLLGCGGGDSEDPTSETVVLVHGSFHTPEATWSRLTKVLDERRIKWATVDLPSAGPDVPPGSSSLPDRTEDVAVTLDVVEQAGGPVVLVGHSYGGMVISEAGAHPAVKHLVYVCAFAPEPGETVIELAASEPPSLLAGAIQFGPGRGLLSVDPAQAIEVFYADVAADVAADAVAKLVPSTASSLLQPAAEVAWIDRPTTYVVCEQDNALSPARERKMAERIGAQIWSLPTSHSPFLSQPEALADIIERVVRAAD
jgi:pimeloyl-ACP methyl ester carboxylesterase